MRKGDEVLRKTSVSSWRCLCFCVRDNTCRMRTKKN